MTSVRQAALEYHAEGRPGKIAIVPSKPVATEHDLSLAYTPGVAEPCREIARCPDEAFRYTARSNLVAVVTNGTAVLGLGNIGPLAGKPVMEGKAVLFKRFADIDALDLEVASEDPEDVIRFCKLLEPTVGGINLEDIRAPDCFIVEERLKELLDIPVFHDDQHGTAIIGGAALVNALEVAGKRIDKVRVVFSGAGASAIATAEHFIKLGVPREHILLVDTVGVVYEGRAEKMNQYKARFASRTKARTLLDAMDGADVFVGLSVGGIVTGEMVEAMAKQPVIFALANPDPEITPEQVAAVRNDAIMATGRSDYPNQVNNVLGFPFIFRGALDVRARQINDAMKLAATHALAGLAREDVPEAVSSAYGGEQFRFGPHYVIPKPFDPRVLLWVAPAVAKAAIESGVARHTIQLDDYRDALEARLGRGREVMRWMANRARSDRKRIVFSDGEHDRVIRAATQLVDDETAHPILLGTAARIHERARALAADLTGIQILDPSQCAETQERYAEEFYLRRQRKGITRAEARERVTRPIYYGCMMVSHGDADAIVAGAEAHYPETIRPALEVIGTADGVKHVAGVYMMVLPRDLLFFADTTVNIRPDAQTLAEIAILTARFVKDLGVEPRIAMISFSNFGSAREEESTIVSQATALVKAQAPDLEVDGEMQADTAVDGQLLRSVYPFSSLRSAANVLIFPNLSAANAAYKLMYKLGGAEAIGPILLGMARPVHVLQRGSSAADIVKLATIAAVDAQVPAPAEVAAD
ncbi:MAG: NADP-dependent malic enzyme [Gemmatimonadetes bacterium]|nr:NADP-dependent malic enzyme [Gemmatimonadota bacterium]